MKNRFNFTRKNPKTKKIENAGYMEIRDAGENGVQLFIYGDIVSSSWDKWSSEDTCPQDISDFMRQIDANADLTVYINSGGGDVFAGIGIHSILSRHVGKITGVVDGIAASIASVILMACDEIVMSDGAQIMIHKPLTIAAGNADDFTKIVEILNKCQESITAIYMNHVNDDVTEDDITGMINAETWMDAEYASMVFSGVTMSGTPAAAACVSWMMDSYKNPPEGIKTKSVEDAAAEAAVEEAALLEEMDLL